jgi:hypothetical protein
VVLQNTDRALSGCLQSLSRSKDWSLAAFKVILVRRGGRLIGARAKGTAVVLHPHKFGYNDRCGFEAVDSTIFPSEYSRRLSARRVGIDGVVISEPTRVDNVIAENPEPKHVTFINPKPDKGAGAGSIG